jgi:hypothetical protein
MPGNGELIRSLRAGGAGAQAAAREIARMGNEGQLNFSPTEAVEVRGIIELPEFKDHYTPEVKASLDKIGSSATSGNQQPPTPVSALTPSLQQVNDARQLPQQFEKDFAAMKQQLVEHPGLTAKEQNARLFEFFTNYAERLAHMVSKAGEAPKDQNKGGQQQGGGAGGKGAMPETYKLHVPPDMVGPSASKLASADLLYSMKANTGPNVTLTAAQKAGVLKEFEQVLNKAGFAEMRDASSGRSGLDVAKELLTMSTARAVRDAAMRANMDVHVRMQAHPTSTIKIDPSLAAEAMRADGTLGAGKANSALPGLKINPDDLSKDARGRDRRGSEGKILGSNMLWNVLHRYRESPEDEELAAQQDRMMEVMIAAGLGFTALAVIAFIWMLF